jgi:capsular polysaccharide biosynthesis protein
MASKDSEDICFPPAVVLRPNRSGRSLPWRPAAVSSRRRSWADVFLVRRWKLTIAVFLLTLIPGALWVSKTVQPVYSAEATLIVPPELAKDGFTADAGITYSSFTNQQIMLILEYRTMSAAVQQLLKQHVLKVLSGETEQQLVDRFRGTLDVHHIPDSFEIVIKAEHSSPKAAAISANTVAKVFLDQSARAAEFSSISPAESILEEKRLVDEQLQEKLAERSKLAQKLQIVDLETDNAAAANFNIINLREALGVATRKRIESDEMLISAHATAGVEAQEIARAEPVNGVVASDLARRRIELEQRIQNLLPGNPIRAEAEARIATINAALQGDPGGQAEKIRAGLLTKAAAENRRAHRLENDFTRKLAEVSAGIPNQSRDLANAQMIIQAIAQLELQAGRIDQKIRLLHPQNTVNGGIRLVSLADPPAAPESSRTLLMLLVLASAMVASLAAGVSAEFMDTRLHDPASAESAIGLPILGTTLARSPKTEALADEYLRRLAVGLERELACGARTILLVGLRKTVPWSFVTELSQQLADDGFSLTVCTDGRQIETNPRPEKIGSMAIEQDQISLPAGVDRRILIMDAEPVIFSAETERLAGEADITLLVAEASVDRRDDLVRSAKMLEKAGVKAFGVILRDLKINRAGRVFRTDRKQFGAINERMARSPGNRRRAFIV